ncbi:MAG: methyltransferase [Alphaproteobacteria bacterium]|nr:methyltransferase [Alphaproteobacteria bacterium]
MHDTTTLDGLLNRRVALEQPRSGYRVAVDTVFLAAATPALPGDRLLDMGCGVGGAMLALACRVPGITGIGIDIQPALIDLCRRNIARNDFAAGLSAQIADAANLPTGFAGAFDHVIANPPYHDEASHDAPSDIVKKTANTEKSGDLALWISSAATALKPGGIVTLIHRADRRTDILAVLAHSFGDVEILPLLTKPDTPAKRIILCARKGGPSAVRENKGVTLHAADGRYTAEADSVLRDAMPLQCMHPRIPE